MQKSDDEVMTNNLEQYSSMKRNPEDNNSPAHQKIIRLLESLQDDTPSEQDPIVAKLEGFRETIISRQQAFQQNLSSISSSLIEMEKTTNSYPNYRQLRMMNSYEQNILDMETLSNQNFNKFIDKIDRQEKALNNKVLSLKMKQAQGEEMFRNELLTMEKDFQDSARLARQDIKQKEGPKFKQINLKSRIHSLQKQIIQMDQSEYKICSLKESEKKMEKLIQEEEEQLNKNFRMHCDTLQKLMKSISQRLE